MIRTEFLCSREHSSAIKGLSALLIMLMHFVMQTEGYPRVVHLVAGPCVAAFLFLSGYGINESWKVTGGAHYWAKRVKNVLVPYWLVILFQLPFLPVFDLSRFAHNIFVYGSDLWFIDFILRWYAVYWVSKKAAGRYAPYLLLAFSLCCFGWENLMAGQAFAFLMGYLASEHKERIQRVTPSTLMGTALAAGLFAISLLALKEHAFFQSDKFSLWFKLVLALINSSMCVCLILLSASCRRICQWPVVQWLGRVSYEIYIVHYNFMPFVCGRWVHVALFSSFSLVISDLFHRILHSLWQLPWQKALSLILFLTVNYLFVCKYGMRMTAHCGYVLLPYLLLLALWGSLLLLPNRFETSVKRWHCALTLVGGLLFLLLVQYSVDPMQIAVDRWSAIENPLRYLFNGEFPYLAPTHLGGKASPFPMWQVFHIPFYLMGNVGLSEVFSIGCFLMSIWYLAGYRQALVASLLTFASVAVLYEVSVRSDMITNFMLLSAFVNFTQRRGTTFGKRPFLLSFLSGLWLSTRLTTVLPLFLLYVPEWLQLSFPRRLLTPLVALLTLVLTFLPLCLWNADALFFDATSPFALQTRQGGTTDVLFTFCLVALMLIIYVRQGTRFTDYNLYAAFSLLTLTFASFLRRMVENDAFNQLFESAFDITYFNASLPFLITAMCLSFHKIQRK